MEMKSLVVAVGLGVAGVAGCIAGVKGCTVVPAGHVTVVSRFGDVKDQELQPGIHWVNPLYSTIDMSVRTHERKEALSVPTKEGLIANLDVSVLYRVDSEKASDIYKNLGTGYEEVVIVPILRDGVRAVIAGHVSEDLYNVKREEIANNIEKRLAEAYAKRGILLEDILLRDVKLPAEVTSAIERKIKAKQEAEAMEYVLAKEKAEASRKEVEASGIASANKIIAEGLTENYLQWKYISTLGDLAKSPNNTFVIMPYDSKLTPLITLDKK